MEKLSYREHEMASKPRMRVWSDDQSRYGQFDVMDHDDFLKLKELCEKYNWLLIEAVDN